LTAWPATFCKSNHQENIMLHKVITASLIAVSIACGAPAFAHGPIPGAPGETIMPAFAHALPNVPGKAVSAVVVTYAPGAKSMPHRHGSAFVVAYVLEGSIRSKLADGQERVYQAGESWTENPGAHHVVSENASAKKPAKLMAFFTADADDKNLVIFDHQEKQSMK
jgi:quercetin dioxygenase-like cupin family protein